MEYNDFDIKHCIQSVSKQCDFMTKNSWNWIITFQVPDTEYADPVLIADILPKISVNLWGSLIKVR